MLYKPRIIISLLISCTLLTSACGANSPSNQTAQSTHATSGLGANQAFPITLTDDAGHVVTLKQAPLQIVSATEGTDEILSALVPKSHIAMVTAFSSDPNYSNIAAYVKGIPAISDAGSDIEQIIAKKPDLVLLASYTKSGVVGQIEQASIPSYEFNSFSSITDIEKNIQIVGRLTGESEKAANLAQTMNQDISSIEAAVSLQKKVSVVDYSAFGFAAGNGTTVNDVIVDAGGVNAAANLPGWAKITDEQIVKMNPDVIIDSLNEKKSFQKIMNDPALQTVNAVKNHRVYFVNSADLTSVSQYVVNAVSDVAHVLYPSVKMPVAIIPQS